MHTSRPRRTLCRMPTRRHGLRALPSRRRHDATPRRDASPTQKLTNPCALNGWLDARAVRLLEATRWHVRCPIESRHALERTHHHLPRRRRPLRRLRFSQSSNRRRAHALSIQRDARRALLAARTLFPSTHSEKFQATRNHNSGARCVFVARTQDRRRAPRVALRPVSNGRPHA